MNGYNLYSSKSWDDTLDDLYHTFDRWGVPSRDVTVFGTRTPKRGGRPVQRDRDANRVTISFRHPSGRTVTVSKDNLTSENNLRALYLSLEDIRMIEKRGLSETVGIVLMQIAGPVSKTPYDRLGVKPNASMSDVEAAYRLKAKTVHPDAGGSHEAMRELNAAIDEIRSERLNGVKG